MKVTLLYIVVSKGKRTEEFCSRFVDTYRRFPALCDHQLIIVCNGGVMPQGIAIKFSGIRTMAYLRPNDGGWDVSAYMELAHGECREADMLVCLGESNYFHRPGWLRRLVDAWEKYGPGMYGPYASNVVRGHLQTTAFCCSPAMLRMYPSKVASRLDRYRFEHGEQSLWRILATRGYPVKLVTWDGEYSPRDWRKPKNVLWSGDQSNLLMFSNHTDHYRDADNVRKRNWSASANRQFR